MRRGSRILALLLVSAATATSLSSPSLDARGQGPSPATPEARAVAFLSVEVPKWRQEHPCHSCHNNGDAARALLAAALRGHDIDGALGETIAWLAQPTQWEENATAGGVDNKPLARIQFAGALTSAVEQGLASREALMAAADLVAKDQQPDGSWRLDSAQNVGSPATYGTPLATWSARRIMMGAGTPRLQPAIARADAWFRAAEAQNVLDAAAVTLGLGHARDPAAVSQRQRCLDLLKVGQGPDGGWGLYTTSASEPFDTSIAMLALLTVAEVPDLSGAGFREADIRNAIIRGRGYLVSEQQEDGSWQETTRPAEQTSYAQRISTTGWATLALLASADR